MPETLYRKAGRRYQPVAYYDEALRGALPFGHHLLTVSPGQQSIAYQVRPDTAPLLAALRACRNDLLRLITEASAPRPAKVLATQQELEAWEAFKRGAGYDLVLIHPSAAEILDRLEKALIALAAENAPDP